MSNGEWGMGNGKWCSNPNLVTQRLLPIPATATKNKDAANATHAANAVNAVNATLALVLAASERNTVSSVCICI